MDTTNINNIVNDNEEKIRLIAKNTAIGLNTILDNFNFINNDDLSLLYSRISQIFLADFNYEFSKIGLFEKIKTENN